MEEFDFKVLNCLIQDIKQAFKIKLIVDPHISLNELKLKIQTDYNIPIEFQYWILNETGEQNFNGNELVVDLLNKNLKSELNYELCLYLKYNLTANGINKLNKFENLENEENNCKNCQNSDSTCKFCKKKILLDSYTLKAFDCPICMNNNLPIQLIYELNPCGHIFCKTCIVAYINNTDSVFEIKCPFTNGNKVCNYEISEADIEKLLDKESLGKYRLKQLNQMELCFNDRFHCLKPNCPGFCVLDKQTESKIFECSICLNKNCIKCKILLADNFLVEHVCYQDKINSINKNLNEENDDGIQELIKNGSILRCPKCNVLIEKKDSGCQLVRCFYCKLDICWLTKQSRWGPRGKGDTSAGCQCGLNGKKCHPDCENCH